MYSEVGNKDTQKTFKWTTVLRNDRNIRPLVKEENVEILSNCNMQYEAGVSAKVAVNRKVLDGDTENKTPTFYDQLYV